MNKPRTSLNHIMRIITLTSIICTYINSLQAQDRILMKNGNSLEVVILKETDTSVQFYLFTDPLKAKYQLDKQDIAKIIYKGMSSVDSLYIEIEKPSDNEINKNIPVVKKYVINENRINKITKNNKEFYLFEVGVINLYRNPLSKYPKYYTMNNKLPAIKINKANLQISLKDNPLSLEMLKKANYSKTILVIIGGAASIIIGSVLINDALNDTTTSLLNLPKTATIAILKIVVGGGLLAGGFIYPFRVIKADYQMNRDIYFTTVKAYNLSVNRNYR